MSNSIALVPIQTSPDAGPVLLADDNDHVLIARPDVSEKKKLLFLNKGTFDAWISWAVDAEDNPLWWPLFKDGESGSSLTLDATSIKGDVLVKNAADGDNVNNLYVLVDDHSGGR